MKDEENNQPPGLIPTNLRFPIIAALVIGGLWLGVLVLALCLPGNGDGDYKAMFGQLGDAFGIMNSLVGGLTIAFALYTISQQSAMIQTQEKQHQQLRKDAKNDLILSKIEEASGGVRDILHNLVKAHGECDIRTGKSAEDIARSMTDILALVAHLSVMSAIYFPSLTELINQTMRPISESFKTLCNYMVHEDSGAEAAKLDALRSEVEKDFSVCENDCRQIKNGLLDLAKTLTRDRSR